MPRRAARSALALPFILAATIAAPGPASAAFDADGFAFHAFTDATRVSSPAADQAPDGGFVVAGGVRTPSEQTPQRGCFECGLESRDLVVTRLGEDGAPLETWGDGGSVTIPGHDDDVSAVRVLADGSIVLWSWRGGWLLRLDAAGTVVREQSVDASEDGWLQNGDLDDDGTLHTFAVDFEAGTTTITSYGAGEPTSVTVDDFLAAKGAVDGHGRFVLVSVEEETDAPGGGQTQLHHVIRVDAAGVRDASFVPAALESVAGDVALAVDGEARPVVQLGTYSEGAWEFHRFTAAGAPDATFGGDGEVVVEDTDLGLGVDNDWGFVTVQDDDKIVANGLAGGEASGNARAYLRLEEDGDVDPTFDESPAGAANGDGILVVDRQRRQFESSPPTPVDRGVIFAFGSWQGFDRSMADAPDGAYVALVKRIGPKPPVTEQPKPEPQPQPQAQTPPPVTVTAQSKTSKTLRSCLSRRSFTIRLRPKALRSATVKVAGKSVKVTRKDGRLTARVDLRKLEQATFDVVVVAKDAKGKTVRETRSYRTCRVGKNGRKVQGGSIITVVQG